MSDVITKTSGFFIINGEPVDLSEGGQVSFPSTAEVQSFKSAKEMHERHRKQCPEWYDALAELGLDL